MWYGSFMANFITPDSERAPEHWTPAWVRDNPGAVLLQYRKLGAEVERLRARVALLEGRAHPMDYDSPAYD